MTQGSGEDQLFGVTDKTKTPITHHSHSKTESNYKHTTARQVSQASIEEEGVFGAVSP